MQGSLFPVQTAGLSRLDLTLAIQRICHRAKAEGKTVVRPATLRKMERQISLLRKAMNQPTNSPA